MSFTTKWGPWPPESASCIQAQNTQLYRIQSANRGADSWADWAREARHSQPEFRTTSSSTWQPSAGGAHAWDWKRDSQPSDWARSSRWLAPAARNLAGPNFEIDREWHASIQAL